MTYVNAVHRIELYYAEMEAARNEAADLYFDARPQLDPIRCRTLFEAGFERGFKKLWDAQHGEQK